MRVAMAVLVVLSTAGLARAAPVIDRVVVVGRPDAASPWSDGPTLARVGEPAELAVIVLARDGGRRLVLADPAVVPLRIGGRAVAARQRRPLGDVVAAVRWAIVEPHGFRASQAANGATSTFYSNVSTERGDFGRWLGYDRIDYFATEVQPWADLATAGRIPARVTSAEPGAVQLAGVGTTRYQATVRLLDGAERASPGAEAVDAFGLLPSVHRVSVRQGDDFLGWLSAYLLVPEVFGSAGGGKNHQTERFTGADCADVMVGALRRTGRAVPYTSVAGLPRFARTVVAATVLDDAGHPAAPITGVRPGDLIRIDYGGALTGHTPRSWDHVAALWEDRSDPAGPAAGGPDGQLDGFDLVIHMGHPRLVIEPLAEQAPATVDVLRWR